MIYDVGMTAVLFLSCRPPSAANHSQNTQHFLRTDCRPYVVRLPALLSPVLIYLIDYELNPCIIPYIWSCSSLQGGGTRLKTQLTISCIFDILFPPFHILDFNRNWEIDYLVRFAKPCM